MPKADQPFHSLKSSALKGASLGLLALLVSACTTTGPIEPNPRVPVVQRPVDPAQPTQTDTQTDPKDETTTPVAPKETDTPETDDDAVEYVNNRDGLTPPFMAGRDTKRLALLLPFSTRSSRLAEEANSMYRAAELAVMERDTNDVLLIALDTKGTEDGAKSATRAAIKAGADVILGPIIAGNVKAASREARRSKTPLLAFSNDQTVAGNGTYLLSFPPEAEVARIVDYAASTGTTRFAYLGPDSAYGRRVKSAYEARIRDTGGEVTAAETYQGNDISVMQEPAQKLATFHAEGEAAARANQGLSPMSFEAILLPEGGTALRSLAPLLPYYDVDPADVQFMGTSRWADPDTVREPALSRGIFAGPDKDARAPFEASYDRAYGEEPSDLASLAYDAVSFGAYVADGNPKSREARAEDPQGFYGVDGLVRFDADGRPERGLAVYQIRGGRFILLDPAPKTVQGGS